MKKMIWIPEHVPSLKNGKIQTRYGPVNSKAIKKWKENTKVYWQDQVRKAEFIRLVALAGMPIFLHMTFVRKGGALWDYMAPAETVCDEIVLHEWINDDNVYQIVPVFGKFRIDKDNPGVEIRIARTPEYKFYD